MTVRPGLGRRAVLLVASVAVAALGVSLIALYVRGADQRATAGAQLVPVLVPRSTVPPNTRADAINTTIGTVKAFLPQKSVPPGAFQGADALQQLQTRGAQVTTAAIAAGVPIRAADFGTSAIEQSAIHREKAGVSVQLSDPQRAANLLRPGDLVAVFAPVKGRTRTVLSGVPVLAIGGQALEAADGRADRQIPSTVLMLELTQNEAEKLLTFQNQSPNGLTLGLLGPKTTFTTPAAAAP